MSSVYDRLIERLMKLEPESPPFVGCIAIEFQSSEEVSLCKYVSNVIEINEIINFLALEAKSIQYNPEEITVENVTITNSKFPNRFEINIVNSIYFIKQPLTKLVFNKEVNSINCTIDNTKEYILVFNI